MRPSFTDLETGAAPGTEAGTAIAEPRGTASGSGAPLASNPELGTGSQPGSALGHAAEAHRRRDLGADPRAEHHDAGDDLDAALAARLAQAAAAWQLAVPAGLQARLRGELAAAPDPLAQLAGLRLDELVLAQACAHGDVRALRVFEAELLSRVPAFLARHPARAEATEVAQILRERLLVAPAGGLPRIAEYTGRGSLIGWLRVATLRTASNLARGARPGVELTESQALSGASPELGVLEQRYGAGVRGALRDAFHALDATERTVLRLHYLDGVTVDQLAPILGTSRATAGRRLIAARDRLGQATLALLGERTRATPAELRSVLRVLVSRLDVSLRGVMDD